VLLEPTPALQIAESAKDEFLWIEPDRRAWTAAFPSYLSDDPRSSLIKTK
jgi:hypothetical protein